MSFFADLQRRAEEIDSLLCVGIDPHAADLPEPGAAGALAFGRRLVQCCAPYALAFKPNAAFFEALGPEGFEALRALIAEIPKEIPVILDAKRGDIASTAEAYARAAFEVLGARAITASPYLGADSVEPLSRDPERGVFLLCHTSNPGAAGIQRLVVEQGGESRPLYLAVAELARAWNTRENLGLVVGATHPDTLARVRAQAPELWILAPGVGAQGGEVEATVRAGRRADGLGLLINASRSIARAADPGQAARALRDEINAARSLPMIQIRDSRAELARRLIASGCVKFGNFTLKSGLSSPIYIDLRHLITDPTLLRQASAEYVPLLRQLRFDRVAALPYAALPIGAAVCLLGGWPLIYPRREAKGYGTQVEVEGSPQPGETAVVLDDLATTGGSKFEAIDKLKAVGVGVQDVVVLIDRQSGAAESLAGAGLRLHAVFTLRGLLDIWQLHGDISAEQADSVRAWLDAA